MRQKRHKTENGTRDVKTDNKRLELLQRIIEVASQQKLLPKFVYDMDAKLGQGRKKRFLQYQKLVKNLYGQEGKSPLKYDPEQALTQQQKLNRKITKLQNNELQIDYFEKVKSKNGAITHNFKVSQLQKLNHPTKKEFLMFSDFNEKKFIKSYSHLFDDQLELRQQSLFRKNRMKTVATIPEEQNEDSSKLIPKPKFNHLKIQELKEKQKGLKKAKHIKLRPLTQHIEIQKTQNLIPTIPIKKTNEKYKPHIEKTKIGKMLNDIDPSILYGKMLKIGSFPSSVPSGSISLTKESLTKYLKFSYERQIRIIDFLEIKPAFSLEEYTALCTKLKLMQVEHIIFMTFLFYDFNNDGYICQNDIRRLRNLVEARKNKILNEDLKLIEAIKEKKQFEAKVLFQQPDTDRLQQMGNPNQPKSNYLELYKLTEVTESTYFNWLKKQTEKKKDGQKTTANGKKDLNNENEQKDKEKRNKILNPFNPSVLKFKFSYFEEKADVRKYIMGIKSTKVYIDFEQFKSKYQNQQENRQLALSVQSRTIQHSKVTREVSKNDSSIGSSRYDQSKSQIKLDLEKRNFKFNYSESIHRPYLWYDLMDKLAGVRYQGLKYEGN